MNATKIQFSKQEMELMQNAEWILTKNGIIEKVGAMFANLSQTLQSKLNIDGNSLPASILASSPKISRGEKYEGLPYVILDYPRVFLKEEIAAVRNLFWWGHFFSTTLHVKGVQAEKLLKKLSNRSLLNLESVYFTIGADEWRHDIQEDQAVPLHTLSHTVITQCWEQHQFIKLIKVFPLNQWQEAPENMKAASYMFVELLKD